MAKPRKELRPIIKFAEQNGWRIKETSRHIQFFAPDGKGIVTASSTPSDFRAGRRLVTDLRRYGLDLPRTVHV